MDFEILKRANITQGEFAYLCGVTRVTAHRWINGRGIHPLAKERVSGMLSAINAAYDANVLPIHSDDFSPVAGYGLVHNKLRESVLKFAA